MALSRRRVEQTLSNKLRMELDERGDHRVYRLHIEGRLVARTKVSRGSRDDLGDDLVKAIAGQLHVPSAFFQELVSCTKERDDYLRYLAETGAI